MTKEEAIEKIREWDFLNKEEREVIETLIPELKESEDERIKKALIRYFTLSDEHAYNEACGVSYRDIIAWLEKQSNLMGALQEANKRIGELVEENYNLREQKPVEWNEEGERIRKEMIFYFTEEIPQCSIQEHADKMKEFIAWLEKQGESADKVEPKFKAGDWIVFNEHHNSVYQVEKIQGLRYYLRHYTGGSMSMHIDNQLIRHWTIQDAKDGDVLHSIGWDNDCIFIFNGIDNWKFDEPNGDKAVATGYCCLFVSSDKMEFGIQGPDCIEVDRVKPATQIQRDLLFQKMKEAGYEWDAEKKELEKIEQKPQRMISAEAKEAMYDKPAWSEEDKNGLGNALWAIQQARTIAKDENDMGNLWYAEKWLKSLKNRCVPQQKPEWSEENEKINRIVSLLYCFNSSMIPELNELVTWLKSLRPQKQSECSIDKAIKWLDDTFYFHDNSSGRGEDYEIVTHDFDSMEEMFESFRKAVPQNHWKPSEEMLEALYRAIPENVMEISEDEILLGKLYQGLKYGKVLSEK